MTDKKLKSLKRDELLEILFAQSKRIEELEQENKELKTRLKSKEIKIQNAGSIAEASIQLNRIFETAQKAADQYLENIYRNHPQE